MLGALALGCFLPGAFAASTGLPTATNHWAFKAPVRPALPKAKNPKWVRTPMDAFILARLEQEKLHPAKEAEKATLLRRLSLDLIGLPPTIAEVDAFLADKSADAWQKQVERLLASPHYGERWGRQWLDAARYADSDGFEKDKPRFIWNYRDWVINAFNRDLPYDQFVIEQIAGDQLPNPTQDQIVATGFLRNSMLNEEGGVDPEQFRMDAMFDRMDAIGKSVLGLTIQCAQCHNHKFDPLTQEEYYKLFAFLNNDHEAPHRWPIRRQNSRNARQFAPPNARSGGRLAPQNLRLGTAHGRLGGFRPQRSARVDARWNVAIRPATMASAFIISPIIPFAPPVTRRRNGRRRFKTTNDLPFIGAFRLEQLTDADLPCNGPGPFRSKACPRSRNSTSKRWTRKIRRTK